MHIHVHDINTKVGVWGKGPCLDRVSFGNTKPPDTFHVIASLEVLSSNLNAHLLVFSPLKSSCFRPTAGPNVVLRWRDVLSEVESSIVLVQTRGSWYSWHQEEHQEEEEG